MISFWKETISKLSDEGLNLLLKDAEWRIGSYLASGNGIDSYVMKQRALIDLVCDELLSRGKVSF